MPASSRVSHLLADEQFPVQVVYLLRKKGHDVALCQKYSQSRSGDGHSDEQILKWATDEGRAVITRNCKHFVALHSTTKPHAGIIATRSLRTILSTPRKSMPRFVM